MCGMASTRSDYVSSIRILLLLLLSASAAMVGLILSQFFHRLISRVCIFQVLLSPSHAPICTSRRTKLTQPLRTTFSSDLSQIKKRNPSRFPSVYWLMHFQGKQTRHNYYLFAMPTTRQIFRALLRFS
jgi:hypothetical protein